MRSRRSLTASPHSRLAHASPRLAGSVVAVLALALSASGQNAPTFYLSSGGAAAGDLAWESAVANVFVEEDLEPFPAPGTLTQFAAGPVTVNVGLGGRRNGGTGTFVGAEMFNSTFGFAQASGTVWHHALLNRSPGAIYSRMTFDFSRPVEGFGAWVFDDWGSVDQTFTLFVVDADGIQYTSTVLATTGQTSGSSNGVEGFLGATSPVGIVHASIISSSGGVELAADFFEVDHLHIGRIVNRAPLANAGIDQAVSEGDLVTLDGSGSSDPDSPVLAYNWTQIAGTVAALDESDPQHPWFVAPFVPVGGDTLSFLLTASDGEKSSTDVVNIAIANVNHPPIAIGAEMLPVFEGSIVTLDGSESWDPDNDTLAYLWLGPAGITLIDDSTPNAWFVAPEVGQAGEEFVFTLAVSDGLELAFASISVRVENIDHAPVALAGADQTRDEGATVFLDGSASFDPDFGDVLTPSWIQVAGPSVQLSDPLAWAPSFVAPLGSGGQDIVLQLFVYDGVLYSVPDSLTIHVRLSNAPPDCSHAFASTCPAKKPKRHGEHEHDDDGDEEHDQRDGCIQGVLWSPEHKLVPVDVAGVSDPDGDPVTIEITSVTQDEPITGLGHGDTGPDAVLRAGQLYLRAERGNNGNGRVYVVHFTARDNHGGECSGSVRVDVPKNKKRDAAIDSGQNYSSFGP